MATKKITLEKIDCSTLELNLLLEQYGDAQYAEKLASPLGLFTRVYTHNNRVKMYWGNLCFDNFTEVKELTKDIFLLVNDNGWAYIFKPKDQAILEKNPIQLHEDIGNGFFLLTDHGGRKCLLRSSDIKKTGWINLNSYENIGNGIWLIDGGRYKYLLNTKGKSMDTTSPFTDYKKLGDGVFLASIDETYFFLGFNERGYRGCRDSGYQATSYKDIGGGLICLTDSDGSKLLFNKNVMKDSFPFFKSKEKYKDDIVILTNTVGGKDFLNIRTMRRTEFGFTSYEEVGEDMVLLSLTGDVKCLLCLSNMYSTGWREFQSYEDIGDGIFIIVESNTKENLGHFVKRKFVNLRQTTETWMDPELKSYRNLGNGFFQLNRNAGSKYFLRLRDMKTSEKYHFDSCWVEKSRIMCESQYGTTAIFQSDSMTMSNWSR